MADAAPAPQAVDTPASPAERGWYPDPEDAARERWHDGTEWTRHTHRALRRAGMFGAAYERGRWPGPNRHARVARVYSAISSILLIAVVTSALVLRRDVEVMTVAGIGMLALVITATAQTALAVRAVRRSRVDGAMSLSVTLVVQGSIFLMISGAYLLTGLVFAILS
jgi:hypothetical protein